MQKAHKESYLPGFNSRLPTKSFVLSLKGLGDLHLADTAFKDDLTNGNAASARYSLQYSCTFYNSNLQGNGGFYGRTYVPEPKILKPSSTAVGSMETFEQDDIFFHTSYTELSSQVVVELIVTRESGAQSVQASGGFARCPVFDFKSSQAMVVNGTPRMMTDEEITQKDRRGKTCLLYELQSVDSLDCLKELVYMNCFVGPREVVPGLEGDFVPPIGQPARMLPKKTLYMHNLSV